MVDYIIENSAAFSTDVLAYTGGPYWKDNISGVFIGMDSSNDVNKYLSKDAGHTWIETTIDTTSSDQVQTYCDYQTSGNHGDNLHIVYSTPSTSGLHYRTVNLSSYSTGAKQTIYTGGFGLSANSSRCYSVVKSHDGTLYATYCFQVGSNDSIDGFKKSTDGGSTWTALNSGLYYRNSIYTERGQLVPANTSDGADIAYIGKQYPDMNIHVYDASADSWSTTKIGNTFSGLGAFDYPDFSVAERHSNGKLAMIWNKERASSAGNLSTYEVEITTPGSATITQIAEIGSKYLGQTITINQNTEDTYIAYTSGTSTYSRTLPYGQVSTNAGSAYGGKYLLSSNSSDDLRTIHSAISIKEGNAGRWMPAWFNDDLNDWLCYSSVAFVNATDWTEELSESLGFTDSPSSSAGYSRILSESYSIEDNQTAVLELIRTLNENFTFDDNTSSQAEYNKILSDSQNMSDSTGKTANFNRDYSETLNLTDNLARAVTKLIQTSDTFNLADALLPQIGLNRSVADTLSISDSLLKSGEVSKVLNDGLSISDVLSKEAFMERVLSENFDMSDDLTSLLSRQFAEALFETFNLSDTLRKDHNLNLAESLVITDLLLRTITQNLQLSDSVRLADKIETDQATSELIEKFLFILNDEIRKLRSGEQYLKLKADTELRQLKSDNQTVKLIGDKSITLS